MFHSINKETEAQNGYVTCPKSTAHPWLNRCHPPKISYDSRLSQSTNIISTVTTEHRPTQSYVTKKKKKEKWLKQSLNLLKVYFSLITRNSRLPRNQIPFIFILPWEWIFSFWLLWMCPQFFHVLMFSKMCLCSHQSRVESWWLPNL